MVVAPVAFPRLSVAVDVLVAATALEVVSRVKHPVVPIAKNGNCAFMAGSRSLTHLNAAPECPVARRHSRPSIESCTMASKGRSALL